MSAPIYYFCVLFLSSWLKFFAVATEFENNNGKKKFVLEWIYVVDMSRNFMLMYFRRAYHCNLHVRFVKRNSVNSTAARLQSALHYRDGFI
jgi:hypothetical protein